MKKKLNSELLDAISEGNLDKVKRWIKLGADINAYSGLPLEAAARRGHVDILQFLLSHPSVDVNTRYSFGETALQVAAFEGETDAVRFLLNVPNIDVNAADNEGFTALMMAIIKENKNIIDLLTNVPSINLNSEATTKDGLTIRTWATDKFPHIIYNPESKNGKTLTDAVGNEKVKAILQHPVRRVDTYEFYKDDPCAYHNRKELMRMVHKRYNQYRVWANLDPLDYSECPRVLFFGPPPTKKDVDTQTSHNKIVKWLHKHF